MKTVLLLGLLSGLCLVGGEALGGRNGLYMGLAFAVLMNFGSYFFSDKIALSMYSRAAGQRDGESRGLPPRRRRSCATWPQRMGLPMPKLYLIPDDSPNAFATGRNPNARLGGLHRRHPAADER